MMKQQFKILSILFLIIITSCTADEEVVFIQGKEPIGTTVDTDISLKEKAKFKIGAAVKTSLLKNDPDYAQSLKDNYNQITAEFEMKMDFIWKGENNYDWEATDYLVQFAEDNNMDIHGHSLVWYRSFPNWFINQNNDSIAFEAKIKTYITDVVTRYKGKIRSWDVVNEVFVENGNLREDAVVTPLFKDPIAFYERCFQYTKDADPGTKLFYNDFNIVIDDGKREAIKNMATRFQTDGFPIDGIGAQFHYGKDTNIDTINEGLIDLATSGLLIHISELDIKMNSSQSDLFVLSSLIAQQQSDIYESIVSTYETFPESQKFGISTWGVSDKYTWLTTEWHAKEQPLLLDSNFNKKIAYLGFLNGLQ